MNLVVSGLAFIAMLSPAAPLAAAVLAATSVYAAGNLVNSIAQSAVADKKSDAMGAGAAAGVVNKDDARRAKEDAEAKKVSGLEILLTVLPFLPGIAKVAGRVIGALGRQARWAQIAAEAQAVNATKAGGAVTSQRFDPARWGKRGARLSLPDTGGKGPAMAVGEYWPEAVDTPTPYTGKSGTRGVKPPRSDLTQPERHVLNPPESGMDQYQGIPKGLSGEEREAWLKANKVPDQHPGSRAHDAEAKIFEDLLAKTSTNSVGEFHFKASHPVCQSCTEMIFRFRAMRPGVQVIQHSP
jgi:hypothetical protein